MEAKNDSGCEKASQVVSASIGRLVNGCDQVLGIPGVKDGFTKLQILRASSVRRHIRDTLSLSRDSAIGAVRACSSSSQDLPSNDTEEAMQAAIEMAESAVSNLLGGITEFSGRQVIEKNPRDMALVPGEFPPPSYGDRNSDKVETEVQTLYTGVPSRAVFPRGFLWDEGFHMALTAAIDPAIAVDVFRAWMSTMNGKGWIPREQILGAEARGAVPPQFRVQRRLVANPPAILVGAAEAIAALESSRIRDSVRKAWSRGEAMSRLWKESESIRNESAAVGSDASVQIGQRGQCSGRSAIAEWDGDVRTAESVLDALEACGAA